MSLISKQISTHNRHYSIGTEVNDGKLSVSFIANSDSEVEYVLYKKNTFEKVYSYVVPKEAFIGNLCEFDIDYFIMDKYDYAILEDGKPVKDYYAKSVNYVDSFGIRKSKQISYSYIDKYDWMYKKPAYDATDLIIYRTNVRSFTKSENSLVNDKGTYMGIVEKIPYLCELGINMLELMPTYEFDECETGTNKIDRSRTNYWGYIEAYYFAPKASYATSSIKASKEYSYMVDMLHKADIMVAMDFYFPDNINKSMILDVLRYWVVEYRIDAININGGCIDYELLKDDYYLADTFIMINGITQQADFYDDIKIKRHLLNYDNNYMNAMRAYNKSDSNSMEKAIYYLTLNNEEVGAVNYITKHDSFSLMDTYMYNQKHNEANGQSGLDGEDNNFSWNCGIEGISKRKKINNLRIKLSKNLMAFMLLSQGIPVIYAGDEMLNTRKGNNNPYCQDNEISYVDWSTSQQSKDMQAYVKWLIAFRKEHKLLHTISAIERMDSIKTNCINELSFGMSLIKDEKIYIAINMHWEKTEYKLPKLLAGDYKMIFTTGVVVKKDNSYILEGRTIAIFIA